MSQLEKFKIGQKVRCLDGKYFYGAKVKACRVGDDLEHTYLVHYDGYNQKFDEWVKESRIIRCVTEDAISSQHSANKAYSKKHQNSESSSNRKRPNDGIENNKKYYEKKINLLRNELTSYNHFLEEKMKLEHRLVVADESIADNLAEFVRNRSE